MKRKQTLLLAVPAVLLAAALVLTLTGVLPFGQSAVVQTTIHNRPRLPNRTAWREPASLSELLHAEKASLDDLLASEKLQDELLRARKLTDIVDSRLALNNLRLLHDDAEALAKADTTLATAAGSAYVAVAKGSAGPDRLAAVRGVLDALLQPSPAAGGPVSPQMDFKGTWTQPDDVLLAWTPHDQWIPETGYRLFRIVNGQETQIGDRLGAVSDLAVRVSKAAPHIDMIQEAFAAATLTKARMQQIGVASAADFASLAYAGGTLNSTRARVSGGRDFDWYRDRLLAVPTSVAEKLPSIDALPLQSLQDANVRQPPFATASVRQAALAALDVRQMAIATAADRLAAQTGGATRAAALREVLQARQSILTKAFVDSGFARDAGLAFRDSLASLGLPKGTVVTYRLEGDGGSWTLPVTTGQEITAARPAGVTGFGIDNAAYLRWQAPTTENDRKIISGYAIERKRTGDKEFSRLTPVPIAIAYSLDETGVYFESPIFYSDTNIGNGESATYRVQAIDIFGRSSAWSDELKVDVVKVTPPGAPAVDLPALSTDAGRRDDAYIKKLGELNRNARGVIVPVSLATPDTVALVIYRARALGAGSFDTPVEIGRAAITNAATGSHDEPVRVGRNSALLRPTARSRTDLAWFDADVAPGYAYKYWAAALDDWGNESVWSVSRVIGVPLDRQPAGPKSLTADLLRNDLPDLSASPPGFGRTIVSGSASAPAGKRTGVSDVVLQAEAGQAQIGVPLSAIAAGSPAPGVLAAAFGNLPNLDDVHALIAVAKDDLRPDNSARITWTPFSGEGLAEYLVYRAQVNGMSRADLQALGRAALVQKLSWQLVASGLAVNQFVDPKLERSDGRLYVYLVALVPQKRFGSQTTAEMAGAFTNFAPGGWVRLAWQAPTDPQIGSYRVYRSEVKGFTPGQDLSKLPWTLVADHVSYTHYTEKVDQTFAHYYHYKVTAVSIWGRESADSAIVSYRVPATSPPETPAMLLPLQQKGKIQVNWAGVDHASKYIVFRTTLPKIREADIIGLQQNQPAIYHGLFQTPNAGDTFLSARFSLAGQRPLKPAADTAILSVDKFNTLQNTAPSAVKAALAKVGAIEKLSLFRSIADTYGPLALAPYSSLSEAAARLVVWDQVAEVPVGTGEDPKRAFQYIDEQVRFGDTYNYTVQAVNDDNLASARPMPVTTTPRKAKAFDPVTGLKGALAGGKPVLTWNQASDVNLNWSESREYVAGYIVYRATEQNGAYYQTSPLLDAVRWTDETADGAAFNWYRVKVVDTAGYLSEFSEAVLVRAAPAYAIRDAARPALARGIDAIQPALATSGPGSALSAPERKSGAADGPVELSSIGPITTLPTYRPIATPTPTLTPTLTPTPAPQVYSTLTIGAFTLHDARLSGSQGALQGTALLSFGNGESFQVLIRDAALGSGGTAQQRQPAILRGMASIEKPVYLPKTGVTFTSLSLPAATGQCTVEGYLQRPSGDAAASTGVSGGSGDEVRKNLIGDLYAIRFAAARITPEGVFTVSSVPGFRYGPVVFAPSANAVVSLDQQASDGTLVTLFRGIATVGPGLETLDNAGLSYGYGKVVFDTAGRLTGAFTLGQTQTLRLVVPAGLGLQATASTLAYRDGAVNKAGSNIQGKLILPFQTFDDKYVPAGPINPARTAAAGVTGFDRFLPRGIVEPGKMEPVAGIAGSLGAAELQDLDSAMAYLGGRIQGSSLLVLPVNTALWPRLSTVPFQIANWGGQGFTLPDTAMTPALVGNSGEPADSAIRVTPGRAAVDLDRQGFVSMQAPAETQGADWLGIIVKEGRLALPPAYVRNDDDKPISFGLTSGALLYDLNGVSYQNLTYNAQGTPANFGSELGGFRDVRIFDCMLDLYANKVNLELNGELGIPLLGYQKVKVRLYTNQDPNSGQKVGKLICTVAETDKIDPSGTNQVLVKIATGQLMPDGLHVAGTLDVAFPGKLAFQDLAFTDLVIPAGMDQLTKAGNPDQAFGKTLFATPLQVRFHDFNIQLRGLIFESARTEATLAQLAPVYAEGVQRTLRLDGQPLTPGSTLPFYQSSLKLMGGMQLSDNLCLDPNESVDRIVIGNAMSQPGIRYDESESRMNIEFAEFLKASGKVKPKVWPDNEKVIEYACDNFDLIFNTISDLYGKNVHSNTRFGYDEKNIRYFFALGSYYDSEEGISFYYGKLNQICGVLGYNVLLPRGPDGRYAIPKGSGALFKAVDNMAVSTVSDPNFFFASTCNIYFAIGYADISIPICDVRDTTIIVETGPVFDSSGDLYAPLDVAALAKGEGFIKAGTTRISYYHPERRFQFSTILYDIPAYTFTVSGEAGFQMNGAFWELMIGYPQPLKATANQLFEMGFGIGFRSSKIPDDSFIKAQAFFGFDNDTTISPVYLRAYLNACADGLYAFDEKLFRLTVLLNGGVEGGIKVAGKRYGIIGFYLDSVGELIGASGQSWQVRADVCVSYSLDLWIDEIEGSVTWQIRQPL